MDTRHLTPIEREFIARVLADAAHELDSLGGARATCAPNGTALSEDNAWNITAFDVAAACHLAADLIGGETRPTNDIAVELKELAETRGDHRLLARIELWRAKSRRMQAQRTQEADSALARIPQSRLAPQELDRELMKRLYGDAAP